MDLSSRTRTDRERQHWVDDRPCHIAQERTFAAALGARPSPCHHEPVGELPPWNRPNERADITPMSRTPTPTAMT
jgi:hypothetical protein